MLTLLLRSSVDVKEPLDKVCIYLYSLRGYSHPQVSLLFWGVVM